MWDLPRVHPCKPCRRSNFFPILWNELRFCMCQTMIPVASGKILLAKTNWFFHEKSSLFQNFQLHSLHLSCHSTCPLPQRVLLSKRTSRLYESLPRVPAALILRQQAILRFWSAPAAWKSIIFINFQHLGLTRVHSCKHWSHSNFSPSLWIELRFCMRQVMTPLASVKILRAKTNWFFHEKSSIFDRNFIYMSGPTCHSTCPLPQRVLLSKRTSRLYESLLCASLFA